MKSRLAAALVLAALALGCASGSTSSSPWSAAAEHEELERRLLALERETTHARLEIERLQRRVAELEAAARPRGAARPTAVPPPPAIPPPARRRSESVPAAPAAPIPNTAGDTVPNTTGDTVRDTTGDTVGGIEESELEEEAASVAPASPATASYESALRILRDGDPADAERALRAFVASAPDSDLADNAWFWIGESLLVRGDARGALEAYRTAIDRYPEGNKIPDALFKLGHALALTGEPGAAREAWSELVRRFPDTAAAERASERLASP
ncbi:MAG TPA: tol-pal system protein YbgF [Thermoanaerobaculia bacterium]|nr:tol-pal system protein YbgF [Thermoanaerobaculia bacterium]